MIVNRSAANLLWPGQSAIGRRLQREDVDVWETVIGVVDDVMQDNFRDPAPPAVYYPLVGQPPAEWQVSSPAYVVKTPRAETIAPEIRALVREVAPGRADVPGVHHGGARAETRLPLAFTMLTLGVISLLAVILGTVGQYGVLSYIVAERTREIGVRMALGAQAGRVQRMVVGQGARVLLVGVVLGLVAAAAVHAGAAEFAVRGGGARSFGLCRCRGRDGARGVAGGVPAGAAGVAGGSDGVAQGRVAGPLGMTVHSLRNAVTGSCLTALRAGR